MEGTFKQCLNGLFVTAAETGDDRQTQQEACMFSLSARLKLTELAGGFEDKQSVYQLSHLQELLYRSFVSVENEKLDTCLYNTCRLIHHFFCLVKQHKLLCRTVRREKQARTLFIKLHYNTAHQECHLTVIMLMKSYLSA